MSTMTAQSIENIWAMVHDSTKGLTFPQTVAALVDLKVTRYHIDYVACTATSYARDTSWSGYEVHVSSIPTPKVTPVDQFVQEGVKSAIQKVQAGKSTYAEFATECIGAGVVGYMAFLDGKNVTYYGAKGEQHVEWFPGADPDLRKRED